MNETKPIPPTLIKISKIVAGLFAFISIVAAQNLFSESSLNQFVIVFRAVAANVAFIAIMSDTKIGRVVSIVFFSLLTIAGLFGIVTSLVGINNSPAISVALLVLSISMLWVSLSHIFGRTSKNYYRELFSKNSFSTTT
ncbi:hypothetical protein [Sapientia aquatica]|uniref:Uncharacterized protein n=1 Tax=Sapientia aquatica TaxID=1549640 RepID=A0A4R5VRL1_9BURK|nr:hypothetical protein [Sapientia aquatica]TDK61336.1 hypothetical protein E2I14_17295 [Sapientia aquatica]